MFRKNLHNILFAIALLIILYGAYRALFGTVEGLGKKQLGKLCIKNKTEISKCGTSGLDLTNKSVFKDFKKAIRAQKKICKADCKSDYDKLGYSSKHKCKQKLCRTKTVANGLLTAAPPVPPPPGGGGGNNGKNDFDENCNEYVDGYIKYIRMLAHDQSGDILLELVPADILEQEAGDKMKLGLMAMWRWSGGDQMESDREFYLYNNPWVDFSDPTLNYFQFIGKDGKMSTGIAGKEDSVNKLLEMIQPTRGMRVEKSKVESVTFHLNDGNVNSAPFNLTFSVDPNDCDENNLPT